MNRCIHVQGMGVSGLNLYSNRWRDKWGKRCEIHRYHSDTVIPKICFPRDARITVCWYCPISDNSLLSCSASPHLLLLCGIALRYLCFSISLGNTFCTVFSLGNRKGEELSWTGLCFRSAYLAVLLSLPGRMLEWSSYACLHQEESTGSRVGTSKTAVVY